MLRRVTLVVFLSVFLVWHPLENAPGDLIVNGDFEAGNSGFTSQYTFAPQGNTTEGQYTVRADPQNWNPAFNATPDHTSGLGQMLVVNGATTGNLFLWQQVVSVKPTTHYEFSSCISTAVGGGPAVLTVEVNGVQVGEEFTAPNAPGTWVNWNATWISGAAKTADIRILNSNLSTFPNDFYVDDIVFMASEDVLLGDVNGDGVVDLLDVAPFVALLTSGDYQAEADINGDGVVSLLDVAPFVELLTGG